MLTPAGGMSDVLPAAREIVVVLIRTLPEYREEKSAERVVCTAILATVRLSVIGTSVIVLTAPTALETTPLITKPLARLALVVTSAKVPLYAAGSSSRIPFITASVAISGRVRLATA